ncbi:uncharacterized protein LOC128960065 [Oppia nitens]|uniref:uncharacterized protein LOC128960065 n=1 Tax=Oppia nitens TaxID=1686743 RepID=UPI0023D9FA85|nr:uncharacterized protein LOC128960065 [Oppia nitens]
MRPIIITINILLAMILLFGLLYANRHTNNKMIEKQVKLLQQQQQSQPLMSSVNRKSCDPIDKSDNMVPVYQQQYPKIICNFKIGERVCGDKCCEKGRACISVSIIGIGICLGLG